MPEASDGLRDCGLDVPARARAHARHPGADVRKRFEVDAEARGEVEPGRTRAVGDREGADDVVLPLELSVENVQDLRHALPPALEDLLVPLLRRPAEHLKTHRAQVAVDRSEERR